jgi:hypothetical protein
VQQNSRIQVSLISAILVASFAGACSDDDAVDSDEQARRAYLGLDTSIEKSIQLGFDGYNAATNANIPEQNRSGDATGTLTITGQVDQGVSANKEMRLYIGMVDYSDGTILVDADGDEVEIDITYQTSEVQLEQPYLQLSLKDIPDGTFTGTLTGAYQLSGDLKGEVELDLTMSGAIQDSGGGLVGRVPGSTTISGTAISGDGLYDVELSI